MIGEPLPFAEEQIGLWLDGDALPPAHRLTPGVVVALAWAFKDRCYACWSSEPARALHAAAAMRRLRDSVLSSLTPPASNEVLALAEWTHGIACAIEGDMELAAQAFDQAAIAFTRAGQPLHAAQTQVPKIMALARLGRYELAVQCAQAALPALLAAGDTQTAAKVLLNLGNLHFQADRYDASLECFRQAAGMFASHGNPENAIMASLALGMALEATGNLVEAEAIYAHSSALAQNHGFTVLQAMVGESLALLNLLRGHYHLALAGLEESRRRYAALEMPQHLAIAEKQLADAYWHLRMLPECLAGYVSSGQRFKSLDMQSDLAWNGVQQGRALALAGQPVAADQALQEAHPIFTQMGNELGVAVVELARAELALANGQTEQAHERAVQAERQCLAAGALAHQLQAQWVQARAHLLQGEAAAAHALFDLTLKVARQHHLLPLQLRCLTGRAMAALDESAARADLEAAVELFEDQRRTLPGEEVRSAFQADHLMPFQELLRLDLNAHERRGLPAAQVLSRLDHLRARTLSDRLDAPEMDERTDERDALRAGTQVLRSQLAWLYRRLRGAQEQAAASAALVSQLRSVEDALLERTRRIRLTRQADDLPKQHSGELDVPALQRCLQPGDALVEYGVLDDELFACVVQPNAVTVHRRLASWALVSQAMQACRFQLEAFCHGNPAMRRRLTELNLRLQQHLQRLHDLVWRPLGLSSDRVHRAMVVPHATLSSLPFAALHDGQAHLSQYTQLAMVPNARVALHALALDNKPVARVLALGDTAQLAHAAQEVAAIVEQMPGCQAFLGESATLKVLNEHGPHADVIHLACHGQFRTDNPVFSAVHLADGPLTAEAVASMRFERATVVLSGCETALAAAHRGDEMLGLPRAFLAAGAARVLASLWPVDDASTAQFMRAFYRGLAQGGSSSQALQQAQAATRLRQPHPFFWAGFALMGRW